MSRTVRFVLELTIADEAEAPEVCDMIFDHLVDDAHFIHGGIVSVNSMDLVPS